MHYQHLANFITFRLRPHDVYIPAMILFLIKNEGFATTAQIARLIYIFEYKYDMAHYETIVEKFAAVLLEEYHIIERESDGYRLLTWPLTLSEINQIGAACHKVARGFFTNLAIDHSYPKRAS